MSVADATTVFIIDDDAGVRESIKDLVESVGLQRCVLRQCARVLVKRAARRTQLPGVGRKTSRHQRLGSSARIEEGRNQDSHHFHHRPRRHPDDRKGNEVRRHRVSH